MDAARRAQDAPDDSLSSHPSQKRPAANRRSAEERPPAASRMAVVPPPFDPSSVSDDVLRLAFARSPSGMTVSALDAAGYGSTTRIAGCWATGPASSWA
jgi:hypothetical protein